MPKAARTEEEIEAVKDEILDRALELIMEDGFDNLTMRGVATRVGVTATTLYNYFSCREEINIWLTYRGFQKLYSLLRENYEKHDDPARRFEEMAHAFLDFAVRYPNYYDFLMNPRTPQYTDYIGTVFEELAAFEKENSINNFLILARAIGDVLRTGKDVDDETVNLRAIEFWADMHGIISLHNSGILFEVDPRSREILEKRVDRIIDSIKSGQ